MQEVTINGRHYEYEEFNNLMEVDSPVVAVVLRAQAQLIEDGFSDGITFEEENAINVLFDSEDNVAAFMMYGDVGSIERTITLAWVAPEHRRSGLHSYLFNQLKDQAKRYGFLRILRGYHKDNHVSGLAQINQGSQMYATNGDYVYTRTDLR